MTTRVLVVALDGADFRLLRPWMEAGELPTLTRLAREGASGPLRSVVPPLTPSAWTSFATGKHPGHHGVFGFTHPDTASEALRPVDAAAIAGATLWDYLRAHEVPSAVVGVPMTYPPTPVPGAMISCFMTPPGRRDFTEPGSVLDEIEARFGPYPLYLDAPVFSVNRSAGSVTRFLQLVEHEAEVKFAVTRWLAERSDARFVMLHIWGTDRIQHELWNLLDATHPLHDVRLAAQMREPILNYYRGLDRRLDELQRALGDDTTTFVISDHGFGPVHHVIDLNWWLVQEGFIRFRRRVPTLLKRALWRLGLTASALTMLRVRLEHALRRGGKNTAPTHLVGVAQRQSRRLVLSFRDVDWARSTAYSPPGLSIGALRVNVRGRERTGCVEPGADYDAVCARLVERLRVLAETHGLDLSSDELITSQALYGIQPDGAASCDAGGPGQSAPDVWFLPLEDGYLPTNLFDFLTNRVVTPNHVWPGNHRMDGVLVAHGPAVRAGCAAEGATMIDLAPTLLHVLGCPVASDMDGRPLVHLLDGEAVARPVRTSEPPASYYGDRASLTDAERDAMISRLRDLGYI